MSLDANTEARIRDLLSRNRVVLFMKGDPNAPQCGFSAQTSGILRDLGADFAHVNVLADPEIREGIKVFGNWPTIPQLYVDGELVGGCDIVTQMAGSGELHQALGLPEPDRTPPTVTVTPAARDMLKQAIADAGGAMVVEIAIDPNFRTRLHLVERDENAVHVEVEGVPLQFPVSGARRAEGLTIDFTDDTRGRGLVLDNPNAPAAVKNITPAQAAEQVRAGTITLIDVRPRDERALATPPVPHLSLDTDAAAIEALAKGAPIAFLCKAGGRSSQAAEQFRQKGYRKVHNVDGGIAAWADMDASVPRY